MATYREMVYMVLDELKLFSDDSSFTEEHVRFLLDKYRMYILKQQYEKEKKEIPESNYQTLCLDLIEVPEIEGESCEEITYLKSNEKIPATLPFGTPKVYPIDYYRSSHVTFVSKERMRFVGCNKFLQNIIYCSLGPDNYLYFTSSNPQFRYMQKARFTALFEDSSKAAELSCEKEDTGCDWMDSSFPLEESFAPLLIQAVVKELAGPSWRPKDDENNANDDLARFATFLSRNSKSSLQKALSED